MKKGDDDLKAQQMLLNIMSNPTMQNLAKLKKKDKITIIH